MFTDIPSYQVEEVDMSQQDWKALEEKNNSEIDCSDTASTDEDV